jgi:hypothetical protein
MDRPLVLAPRRSLVARVGLPRPPRGADGTTSVRPTEGQSILNCSFGKTHALLSVSIA